MYHRAGQGAGDSPDSLHVGNHQAAQLVDVFGFGANDHVVGPGDVFSGGDTGDARDFLSHRGCLAYLGLYEDVSLYQGAPLSSAGQFRPGKLEAQTYLRWRP